MNNNVTELNFENIKENLKEYYNRPTSPFKDWDFEGSGLNYLLDILAYNTHYNAVNAHLTMNESFIDSAQIRANVVSRAKLIGYVPRSKTASVAKADIFFPRVIGSTADSLILPKGAEFESTATSDVFNFVTLSSYEAPYDATTSGFTFKNVELVQGEIVTERFVVDSSNVLQKFTLENLDIDTSTLNVIVYENVNSSDSVAYISHRNFSTLDRNSRVYFLSESYNGKYVIQFGDDIIGKKLDNMNIIEISYVVTEGNNLNGVSRFSFMKASDDFEDEIENGAELYYNVSPAQGGDDRETTEEIRLTAPISYVAQDRAITEEDYEAVLRQNIPNIDAITIWGGQYNDPPIYGKVFISIKPKDANYMTDYEKQNVLALVKRKNILTVTPEFVDPNYTYLFFEIFFRYNKKQTALSQAQLESKVLSTVQKYDEQELQNFDRLFRYSNFLRAIDNTDSSIQSSLARVYIYKEHLLESGNRTPTFVDFKIPFHGVYNQTNPIISSSSWRFNNQYLYLSDEKINGDTINRRVFAYKFALDKVTKIKVFPDVGQVNIKTGKISLDSLPTDDDTMIRISAIPASNDVISVQNQMLLIDSGRTTVIGSSDEAPSELEVGSSKFKSFETIRNND